MYAWEAPFNKLITMARRMELKIVLKNSYVRALYMTFMLFTTRMALFCTMLSIALLYGAGNITSAKIFVISAYFNIIAHTMSQMFVRGVAEIAEALVAFKRLQRFLEYDEKNEKGVVFVIDGINGDANDVSFIWKSFWKPTFVDQFFFVMKFVEQQSTEANETNWNAAQHFGADQERYCAMGCVEH